MLRECTGTRQRQSAQERGAGREQHSAGSREGKASGQEDRKGMALGNAGKKILG